MFASGFVLVSLVFVAACLLRLCMVKEPEWVELFGGGLLLFGLLLMVGSVLIAAARYLWAFLP